MMQIVREKSRVILLATMLIIPLGSLASCSKVEKNLVEELAVKEGWKNQAGSVGNSEDNDSEKKLRDHSTRSKNIGMCQE